MTEFLMEYGLFLAKTITLVAAIVLVIGSSLAVSRRVRPQEKLEVRELNEKYEQMRDTIKSVLLSKQEWKKLHKDAKKRRKLQKRRGAADQPTKRIFVINFHGDIKATAVTSLREEVTAVLSVATPEDEVLLRLENTGGIVHEHGFAASQLQRLRAANIPLTAAVDKVAASGGYMMACVANRIIAAPFAVVGSIGVLAQLPNFHNLLSRHGVEFEQETAGEFKRTLTMFGKNTDTERKKLREQIEDIHQLFKMFIAEHRPTLDLSKVATGEHWYGSRALELGLVDGLRTSDDYLLEASASARIFEVSYSGRKNLAERFFSSMQRAAAGADSWHAGRSNLPPVL